MRYYLGKVFADVVKALMIIQVGPKSGNKCSYDNRHTENGLVRREVKIRVIHSHPQAQEHQQPPEAGEARKGSPLSLLR